mgnify:FL=1|tara:strand:- start:478 stop:672 length:195 start_codon:yes stop_codon:yes gene_type:complete
MSKPVFLVSDKPDDRPVRTFRNVSSGQFSATVMSGTVYARASAMANTAIRKALRSPPALPDTKR